MNCQEVRDLFSDYLDQRLAPSQVVPLEEHVKTCSACGHELAQFRAIISMTASLGEIETSPDFLARVNEKIDGGRNPGRLWSRLVEPMRIKLPLEAAALLLVSTLAFYLYHRSPELSEKSLVVPETKVEPLAEQPREKRAEPSGQAPAPKPLPAPAPEKDMRLQETEVATLPKQEPRATELSAAHEEPAKQGARFSLEVRKAPATAPMAAALAEAERQRSQAQGAGVTGAVSFKLAQSAPSAPAIELVSEDIALAVRQVKSLVEELGGKIASERASEDGILLALELPQSRQAEFQSALKQESIRKQRGISAFWEPAEPRSPSEPPAKGALQGPRAALPQAKKSTQEKDEPTVKIELRIRQKP